MNGVLHLGHAFTLSKVEFSSRYQRLKGKKVLFPFAFHCTGMPIQAAAGKLGRELLKYGNPPIFPTEDEEKVKEKVVIKKEVGANMAKSKKGKIAKKASKQATQWGILSEMDVDSAELAKFSDPLYWLSYFPPIAQDHLKEFGLATDFRRSFITTDVNPFYDSFIRWQFNTLKKVA